MKTEWFWAEKIPDSGHCHLGSSHYTLWPLLFLPSSLIPQCQQHFWGIVHCGLGSRLAWENICFSFLGCLTWLACPPGPAGQPHKRLCQQRSMKWQWQSLRAPVLQPHTYTHIWLSSQLLRKVEGEDYLTQCSAESSSVLEGWRWACMCHFHAFFSWLRMSCFELPDHHHETIIYFWLKHNENITISEEDFWQLC